MQEKSFQCRGGDGELLFVREWVDDPTRLRGALLIAHGAAEHGGRYARLARLLVERGYLVWAPDHRGHGKTAGTRERAGDAGPDGFNGMVRDLRCVLDLMQEKAGRRTPAFLLGHSMGAALSQRFIQLHAQRLRGVILSGSPGLRPNLEATAEFAEKNAEGASSTEPSQLLQQAFANYNVGFEPTTTGFEWLSRDAVEVEQYANDPWCGFPFTNRLVAQMMRCAEIAARPENIRAIPKSLAVLLFAGARDPVGGNGRYVEDLASAYRGAGIADVQVILYPEGRHEMLNELNRDQVHADLLAWLSAHVT